MGEVFLVRDRALDRDVALKVIRVDLASHPAILDRFKREIQLSSNITHKNVLPDREPFNQYTIPRMAEMVRPWGPRYELFETRLSERLNLNVPFTQTNFAQQVAEELGQVCQLGRIIDEALSRLWGQELHRG